MATHVFTINGTSLATLGIDSIVFDFVNQDADTARLRLVDGGTPRATWTYGSAIRIIRDGSLCFHGWVSDVGSSAASGDSGVEVVVSGPWFWMERTTFCRRVNNVVEPVVNLYMQDGVRRGPVPAMREVLNWAKQGQMAVVSIGSLAPSDPPEEPPIEWADGITCAEAARKIAAWCPESALFCNYASGFPSIEWRAPGARAQHTFAIGSAPMTSATIQKIDNLVPTGVVVSYSGDRADSADEAPAFAVDAYPTGVNAGSPGVLVAALTSDDYTGFSFAQKLYSKAAMFAWSGTVQLTGEWRDIKPGDLVTVTGRADWAGNRCLVQRVSYDTRSYQTTIALGPPSHLGISDLRDLIWWLGADTSSGPEVETEHEPFSLHLAKATTPPYGTVVRIAPGYVGDGTTQVMPRWQGRELNDDPPPQEKFWFLYEEEYFLKVRWRPDRDSFVGYDANGDSVTTYRAIGTGRVISAEIVTSRQDNIAPVVGITSGAVTDGWFWFALAEGRWVDGALEKTQHQSGGLELMFIPPNRLYFL